MKCQRAKSATFFIIRHGERQDHVDPTWALSAQKPDDPPLTESGRRQAYLIGQRLQSLLMEKADLSRSIPILTSPLLRCMQTATAIVAGLGKLGTRAVVKPDFGLCEWLNEDYFDHQLGMDDFDSDDSTQQSVNQFPKFPESYPAMLGRAIAFSKRLDQWTQSPSSPSIVILVTHGAMVNGLMEGFLGNPFFQQIAIASLSCVKRSFTGQYQPTMFADTAHLP
ncbi:hypothetical protein L0F63_000946 [Massospora cicadina]|nr:hypothetical protein L0F63_000946 [Massospora cicadina]